jgi:DNA-binding NtrC family response regulator
MLRVPPLRERGDDWLFLLDYALFRLHQKYGVAKKFSREALDSLSTYKWPGNVRQVISVATMGYALADGDTISLPDFEAQLEFGGGSPSDYVEELFERITLGQQTFWEAVYEPFMKRDLNRVQVKAVIKKGLASSEGSYQKLIDSIGLSRNEYQRFMDFLRHQDLKP